jgi:adenylate kinase
MKKSDVEIIVVTGKSGSGKQERINVLVKEFQLKQLSTGDIFREYLGLLNRLDLKEEPNDYWDDSSDEFLPDEQIKENLEKDGCNVRLDDCVLGIKAKHYVNSGIFVPDKITNGLFESYFKKYDYTGVVLDGYPRTLDQSKFLLDLLDKKGKKISFIVVVDMEDEKIIKRTTGRRICPKDKKVFHMQHKPPREGKYCTICGTEVIQRSDDTEESIKTRLQEFQVKTIPALEYLKERNIPVVSVPGDLEVFTEENVKKSVMREIEGLFD